MKYTIEIDVKDDGDTIEDVHIHMRAMDYYLALVDLRDEFRRSWKYLEDTSTDWNVVWDKFWGILGERDISLDL